MSNPAFEKHMAMDLDEPVPQSIEPVAPVDAANLMQLDVLPPELALPAVDAAAAHDSAPALSISGPVQPDTEMADRPAAAPSAPVKSRAIPKGRAERDFKATKPKKSNVINAGPSQKTYNALYTGQNKLKMSNFKVNAATGEMERLHEFTETGFNQLHGQTQAKEVPAKAEKPEGKQPTKKRLTKKSAALDVAEDDESEAEPPPQRKSRKRKAQKPAREDTDDSDTDSPNQPASTTGAATHTGSNTLVAYPGGVILPEKIYKRRPRSFVDLRASQIVRHISEVMLSQLGRSDKGAVEVESMYVPSTNTLVVATNNLNAISSFADDIKKDVTNDPAFAEADTFLGDLIRAIAVNQEKLSYRDGTSLAKLDAAIHGQRSKKFGKTQDGNDARQLVTLIKNNVAGPDILSHTAVAKHLDSKRPGIFLMHTSGIHAEQQLLRALLASGLRTQRTIIRGARNPCFGCYLALKYAREKLGVTGLNYGDEPGFTWNGSLASGAAIGAEALIKDCNLDGVKIDDYRTWVTREIASYVSNGANGSVPIRNRDERTDPPEEGLTAPYSRKGLSAEGDAAASDSDDEDVNAPLLEDMNKTISAIRTARGIEPKPPKRRKVAGKDEGAPESLDADTPATGAVFKFDPGDGFVSGASTQEKKRRAKATTGNGTTRKGTGKNK